MRFRNAISPIFNPSLRINFLFERPKNDATLTFYESLDILLYLLRCYTFAESCESLNHSTRWKKIGEKTGLKCCSLQVHLSSFTTTLAPMQHPISDTLALSFSHSLSVFLSLSLSLSLTLSQSFFSLSLCFPSL